MQPANHIRSSRAAAGSTGRASLCPLSPNVVARAPTGHQGARSCTTVHTIDIVPIAEDHIESQHRTLDVIAREWRYLSLLEAPLEATRKLRPPHHRAWLSATRCACRGEVVGWCEVTPKSRPALAHAGVLGMGLLQPFRGRGTGTRLLRTLDASRTSRLQLIKARLQEPSLGGLAGKLQRSLVGRPRGVGEA